MAAIMHFDENPNRPHDPFADKRIEETKKGLFGFFVIRYRLTFLIIFAIIVMGLISMLTLPRESDPEVKIPIAVVTTIFPGASPSDVETLVTKKIESQLENLSDVRLITSQSRLGLSSITVEFQAEADLEKSVRELKDEVIAVTGLPGETEDPFVTEVRANDQPIITFSLAGDLSDKQLKQLGELIQNELENIPGVSEVPLLGARKRELSVTVNGGKLNQLNISLNTIARAISSTNLDTPLGSITINNIDYNLRTVSKLTSIEDLRKVVVGQSPNGSPIILSDIAAVEDVLAEKKTLSRISLNGSPPLNTVSLQILKKTGGNILDIVDSAKERLQELKDEGVIPIHVQIETNTDVSSFIRKDLNTLGRSGILATILIFIVMFLALSFKEAIISLLAIPLTFLITFIVLDIRGDTLNSLSLFSLVLSLGLLVDTFIVVLEGIFHNMRSGYGAFEAALLAIAHYRKPLTSGVFTTIAAFIPMLLVSGILGEFLKVLPITISTVLFSALFVTFIIVPTLAAVFMRRKTAKDSKKESLLERYLTNSLRRKYRVSVASFLASRKKRKYFTLSISLLFIVSIGLLVSGVIPVQLFPKVDIDFGFINIEMPLGTDKVETNAIVQKVEQYLLGRDDIKSFVTTVGRGASFGFNESSQASDHLASINVNFTELKDRKLKSFEINSAMRKDLASIKEGKINVREISSGPPTGAPIEVRVTGEEITTLSTISAQLIDEMEAINGIIDITSDQDISPADLTFTLNRDALARSNLTVNEVAGFLRTAIFGTIATEVNLEGEDIDVIVKLDNEKIKSVEEVKNISILNSSGISVKLARLADFSLQPALATIRHRNFEKTVTVQANLEAGLIAGDVIPKVENAMKQKNIPDGYNLEFGGEVEDIEQSFSELWTAMIVAVVLILIILVLQFDSFVMPFVVIMALPLMLIGVTFGIFILRLPYSFSVFLGLIALAGIAVNDAIVLIDKANRNLDERDMTPSQAVADAGDKRLQPILLTSITTIIGIVPLAFADEFWVGLSVAIAFGLAFATIMQLYVIPMLYVKFGCKYWKQKNGPSVSGQQRLLKAPQQPTDASHITWI